MRIVRSIPLVLVLASTLTATAQDDVPKTIAESVGGALKHTQARFLEIAEAMPETKYSFIPTAGAFKDARSSLSR